ncbi:MULTISPECIES: DUF6457 domain-containing protein [unclassified Microbacterium]|uniref:DUF6457 domain-containing protein n=1 Tax=Microbacterium TaxID=33882 RepID=UPI003BA2D0D1
MTETTDRTLPPEALDTWVDAVCERLDLPREEVSIALVLDLARDVAHDVARPAAPVSAFLAGLAAGRRGGSADEAEAAVRLVAALAAEWRDGAAR